MTIDSLARYRWTGHAVLLGYRECAAQDVDFVLSQFGSTVGAARRAYARFVRAGVQTGAPLDLEGGGLRRSTSGWELVATLGRGRERWECDERILGGGELVRQTLARLSAGPVRPPGDAGAMLDDLCARTAAYFGVSEHEISSASLRRRVVAARAVLCQLAVCRHGFSLSTLARRLSISRTSVARAVERAAAVYAEYGCRPTDFLQD